MDKKEFIITTNKETAAILEKSGIPKICITDGTWYFLNTGTMIFSNLRDIGYTNKLCL